MTKTKKRVSQVDVTLDLDADILEWFKLRAKDGKGYQTAINAALRKVVAETTER